MGSIIITGARAPVALHLLRLFAGAGWQVHLVDSLRFPLARFSRQATYHRIPAPALDFRGFTHALAKIADRVNATLIWPTCEEVFYAARARDEGKLPCPVFAPSLELLARVHHKADFVGVVRAAGLPVPETHLVTSSTAIAPFAERSEDWVFKPAWSRFASRVLVGPDAATLARIRPEANAPWLVQERVEGDEISVCAVANRGNLLTCAPYRSTFRAGRGAGVSFHLVTETDIRDWVTQVVGYMNWTGQISFDLMRRPDGSLLPLECNPRATSGVHFYRDPTTFLAVLKGDTSYVPPDVTAPQAVRLALWLYGLPSALFQGRGADFREELRYAEDVLSVPGDRGPARGQWLSLAELSGRALRRRISLQAASTWDIEWNGNYSAME